MKKVIVVIMTIAMFSGCANKKSYTFKDYKEISISTIAVLVGGKNPYPGKNIGVVLGTAIGGALSSTY